MLDLVDMLAREYEAMDPGDERFAGLPVRLVETREVRLLLGDKGYARKPVGTDGCRGFGSSLSGYFDRADAIHGCPGTMALSSVRGSILQ
ncbi:hypothetical protein GUI43_01265 [Micromonospora noduli]|nr:hypothetical protein LUPAC07_02892 [Micromonospora noduli]RAO17026.1 hypothetical protein GUI43_01265 [Micromonospora noduli]RAO36495.1 hypothetical protein ONO23_01552 [Micromonospora noduli]